MALTKATNRMITGAAFNVLDFGADVTGTSDVSTAFQAAIDAAVAAGRSVYIPGGDYKLSAKLSIPSDIAIYGDGYISRIFRDTSVAAFDMMEVKNKNHVVLKDFLIDGVTKLDNAVAANRYSGIRIWADGGSRPNDIEVVGIHINNTTNAENQTEGNRGCLLIEDAFDVRVRQCKFYGNIGTAILIEIKNGTSGVNCEQIQIEQCWGIGEQAPYLATYPNGFGSFISGGHHQDVLVSGCYCDGFGFSNISMNGPRSTVQNCISLNATFAGINVGHTNANNNCDDSVIQGNICRGSGYEGILVAGSKNLVIDGNVLRDNSQTASRQEIRILHDGNYDAGETKKVIISNNNILESNNTGVTVECGTDIFFTGNVVADSTLAGIFVRQKESSETMNIFITNNHFHDNGGDAAAIEVNSDTASGYGQVNAVCMNNIIDSSDATTVQQIGIMAVGDLADIQVHDNWFAATYSGTGVNTNFAARQAKPLNAFSSGSVTNANIINA